MIPETILDRRPVRVRELYDRWEGFLDRNVRFTMPFSKVHAKPHCKRVLLHALTIGNLLCPDDDEAAEILAHAAVFHDSRRHDDYIDRGHGARAAVYYGEYCDSHPEITYHPEAAEIMRFHDIDDKAGLADIARRFPNDSGRVAKLYSIFKDADALDRFRLGGSGFDARYLRTDAARSMIDEAKSLVEQTTDPALLRSLAAEVEEAISTRNEPKRMLLIVDPQIDFINGSLSVAGAVEAMDRLTDYVRETAGRYVVIALTADRHPYDHISFTGSGGEWPRHCVADTVGAAFWPGLFDAVHEAALAVVVMHKGEDRDHEEYSAFASERNRTVVRRLAEEWNIGRVDVCGLAGDVCVLSTLRDGIRAFPELHFDVLERFSPSIDGGKALSAFVDKYLRKI